jgi:hypothetical protein
MCFDAIGTGSSEKKFVTLYEISGACLSALVQRFIIRYLKVIHVITGFAQKMRVRGNAGVVSLYGESHAGDDTVVGEQF